MINKLTVNNLTFGYTGTDVLHNFFMTIGDGQIVSIVGPNGSGKSTLIKCIDRILDPRSGDVLVDRQDLLKMKRKDAARRIAYVPQNSLRVFAHTVFDVVLMGRRPHLGWKANELDEGKVWEVLRLLGIEGLALAFFSELSGGQQQKVLIARALAQNTGILLLDEPTSNLDIWHQIDVMEILRTLVRRQRLTAIIAIHDLNMAARYSDRMLMMKKGKILANGMPDDVLTPDNLEAVYGIKATVKRIGDSPFVIPLSRVPANGHGRACY
jgi:iron complex transport system ATP-binding protein